MNVYVEYVILDNFVIDVLLLLAAALTLKLPIKKYRLILGGLVGSACAVVSVFVTGFWIYLVKTACLALMCVTVVGFGKKLFWYILLTVAYTFALGGAITGLFHLFKISYVNENGEFYQMKVPLFVYALAVGIVAFLCYSIVFYVRQTKKVAPFLTKISVTLDKQYSLTGFCDSGNTLIHEGLPVCFVTQKFNGFAEYFARQTLLGKICSIEVVTVAGVQKVSAVKTGGTANGKTLETFLALPKEKCKTAGYSVLLSSEFINDCAPSEHGAVVEE